MKKKDHPLIKMQEQTLKVGLEWLSRVNLRCALEGCRYGNEFIDKKPLDKCMYCGVGNISNYDFWKGMSDDITVGKKTRKNKKTIGNI